MARAIGRLDDIIAQLEKLHKDADGILDAYVDELRCSTLGIPFGVLKTCEIANRAGSTLDRIAALKMLRDRFTKQKALNE
jgi:hypothetical protein